MNTEFRIYTETIITPAGNNLAGALAGYYFDGYNVAETTGYWRGQKEASTVITILAERTDAYKVSALAKRIKIELGQEAVLWTATDVRSHLI